MQVVKALQSLLSKAAAVTLPSPPIQASTIAHTGPVQPSQHSLFQQRCQWPPVASAHDPADFAAELMWGHSAPAHSLTQAADRYEHHSGITCLHVHIYQLQFCIGISNRKGMACAHDPGRPPIWISTVIL